MEFILSIAGLIWKSAVFILPFLLVLGSIVFVHEFGHFIVGLLCGAVAKIFSLGVGPELVGFDDRRGTRWRLSALPLGGYVKFAGDQNATGEPDPDAIAAMTDDERKMSLAGQKLPSRAAIVAAGPLANFVFAILVFAASAYVFGETKLAPRVADVASGSAAAQAGFKAGDIVKSIDGEPADSFQDLSQTVAGKGGQTLSIVVERDGQELTLVAMPVIAMIDSPLGRENRGYLGLQASSDPRDLSTNFPGILAALQIGTARSWDIARQTGVYVAHLVRGNETPAKLSGPIRIAQISNLVAASGIPALLNFAALLSVSLGMINLVPIPMLDGGHLLFYAIEGVRGRPLGRKAQDFSLRVGIAVVIGLMIFVTVNDICRILAP
jgi:regulator of sigma E protease